MSGGGSLDQAVWSSRPCVTFCSQHDRADNAEVLTRDLYAKPQAGMTLIELMVVVAIVGILSAVAVVMVSRGPGIGMVANTMANEIGEASRKGVAAGPLDPAVIAAEGFTARSRVFLHGDSSTGGRYYYAVEIRREDEASPVPASNWEEISRGYLPEGMVIAGIEKGVARTEPGSAVVTPLDPSGVDIECEVSGRCEATTIYLQTTDSQPEKWRIVVMPLAAAPLVLADW